MPEFSLGFSWSSIESSEKYYKLLVFFALVLQGLCLSSPNVIVVDWRNYRRLILFACKSWSGFTVWQYKVSVIQLYKEHIIKRRCFQIKSADGKLLKLAMKLFIKSQIDTVDNFRCIINFYIVSNKVNRVNERKKLKKHRGYNILYFIVNVSEFQKFWWKVINLKR